jgi:hypothetical protein
MNDDDKTDPMDPMDPVDPTDPVEEETQRIEVDELGLNPSSVETLHWFTDFLVSLQESKPILHSGGRDLVKRWLALGEILGIGYILPHTCLIHDNEEGTTVVSMIMCGDEILLNQIEDALDDIDMDAAVTRMKDPLKYN